MQQALDLWNQFTEWLSTQMPMFRVSPDEAWRAFAGFNPEIVAGYGSRLDRITLDALLWILGGFSNDYSKPRTERWSAEEDARLIAYYRAHSPNGRLAYEAMMELKLKFRTRSKPALYGRICELRKAHRLDPPTGYSHGSSVATIFRATNRAATLAPTLSGGAC